MKKIILISIILLQTAVSFGQTKEETTRWLTEKLGKSIYSAYGEEPTLESIDECNIVFSVQTWPSLRKTKYIIPTSTILVSDDGKIESKLQDINYDGGFQNSTKMELKETEENLRDRALKHLATFCPKKVETF